VQSAYATRKFFEIKTLTSKPLGLNILRWHFCRTRAKQGIHRLRGRGYPPICPEFPFRHQFRKAQEGSERTFFRRYPQAAR
jgi:hypothetical protein